MSHKFSVIVLLSVHLTLACLFEFTISRFFSFNSLTEGRDRSGIISIWNPNATMVSVVSSIASSMIMFALIFGALCTGTVVAAPIDNDGMPLFGTIPITYQPRQTVLLGW